MVFLGGKCWWKRSPGQVFKSKFPFSLRTLCVWKLNKAKDGTLYSLQSQFFCNLRFSKKDLAVQGGRAISRGYLHILSGIFTFLFILKWVLPHKSPNISNDFKATESPSSSHRATFYFKFCLLHCFWNSYKASFQRFDFSSQNLQNIEMAN